MATETYIPVGMLFRKMYCSHCGNLLKRQKVKKTYRRGEPGFRNTLKSNPGTINIKYYTTIYYVYCCPGCQNVVSYEQQKIIAREQAKLQKKVLIEKAEDDSIT